MKKSFFIVIMILVLLNSLVFYYSNCVGDYAQSSNIWGSSYLIDKKTLAQSYAVLKTLPNDNAKANELLNENINRLHSFSNAVKYNSGDTSALYYWNNTTNRRVQAENVYEEFLDSKYKDNISVLENDIAVYNLAIINLGNRSNYEKYIDNVSGIADDLMTVSLYKGNGTWIASNIMKTKKDFYGLENIKLSVEMNEGLDVIVNYRISDIFAILLCVVTALFSFLSFKQRTGSVLLTRKFSFLNGVLLLSAMIVIIYVINIILAGNFIGIGNLNANIQSCSSFKSCTFFMNTGSFLILWIISKLAGCLVVYFAVIFGAANIKGLNSILKKIIPLSLFFILELFFYSFTLNSDNPLFTFLKEINVFSTFDLQRFFTRYFNLNIFDLAVSRLTVFVAFISAVFLISIVMATKGISAYKLKVRVNAERVYYDEINTRYAEFRSIWHDMQNHLLALNMLIENNDTDTAKNYINEVSEKLVKNLLPVKTGKRGSAVLDALLFKKLETTKQKDIELTYNITFSPCEFGISDYELCCIFGNILDNAIEAVEYLKSDCRKISLTTSRQHEMLYICCENPYFNELNEDKRKGVFLTTKADKKIHGIGLSRVNNIARKHNGNMKINAENDIFKIEILLNSDEKAKFRDKQ